MLCKYFLAVTFFVYYYPFHRCRYLVTSADTQGASNPEFKKDLFAAGLFF